MTTATITPSGSGAYARLAEFAATVAFHVVRIGRAYKNRRAMQSLAGLDDRMLTDIGLSRGDVRDAFAAPPWLDPSRLLVTRARERRFAGRPTSRFVTHVLAPPTVPDFPADGDASPAVRVRYY